MTWIVNLSKILIYEIFKTSTHFNEFLIVDTSEAYNYMTDL